MTSSNASELHEYQILVTGVCGFLGRKLIQSLLARHAFVIGMDLINTSNLSFANAFSHKNFQIVLGDFSDNSNKIISSFRNEKRKKTAVFHMAGMTHAGECSKNPETAFNSNVLLTCKVLEFCRENSISQFIFPSTGLIYGDYCHEAITEKTATNASVNIYATTKLAAEIIIQGYAKQFNMSCIIARLSNVYGPGMNMDTAIGTVVNQLKSGKEPIMVNNWASIRDFIYCDDVIEGIIRLFVTLDNPGYYTVNLSTGIGTSVRKVVETLCRLSSKSIRCVKSQCEKSNMASSIILDNSLFREITAWEPEYSLQKGLALTLKGFV